MFHTGVIFSFSSVLQEQQACVCMHVSSLGRSSPSAFEGSALQSCFHTALAIGFLSQLTPSLLMDTSEKCPGANTFHLLTTEAPRGVERKVGFQPANAIALRNKRALLKNKYFNHISPPVVNTKQLMPFRHCALCSSSLNKQQIPGHVQDEHS